MYAETTPSTGWQERARGDWNDLDAAIEAALGPNELARVGAWSPSQAPSYFVHAPRDTEERERTVELVTAGAETVIIRATRAAAGDPGAIELTVRVGRFGDEGRERAIARDIVARLEQLAGVDVAPLKRR
ncbi:MAG: hypothetical protein SFY69_03740 [Planctomycetota bacterium]|nr:hypothetical protein [Planctomycetota bacterium]